MEKYWEDDVALVESMGPKITKPVADNILLSEGGRTWVLRITSPEYKQVSKEVYGKIKEIILESVNSHIASTKERAKAKGHEFKEEDMVIEIDFAVQPNNRPVLHRNKDMVQLADKSAGQTINNYQRQNKGILGTEDFSFYLEELRNKKIDGVFVIVGAANPHNGFPRTPHHSPEFKIDPAAINDLSKLHAMFTVNYLDYLKNNKST